MSKAVSKFAAEDGVHKWVWKVGSPKSREFNRRVAVPEIVVELLSALRQTSKEPEGLRFHDLRHRADSSPCTRIGGGRGQLGFGIIRGSPKMPAAGRRAGIVLA